MISLQRISIGGSQEIGILLLDQPDSANALSAELIAELTSKFQELKSDTSLRCLFLSGKGKHFCAGANLAWMRAAAKLSYDENLKDAVRLQTMFESLRALPFPTVAITHGSIYGGGVGFAAACDYVIAVEGSTFCLSEVKLGLIPAVILPYLGRKMQQGFLARAGLSAATFNATVAQESGLVQKVVAKNSLDELIRSEIKQLLLCGPEAQRTYKKLLRKLEDSSWPITDDNAAAIATLRVGSEAQEGMRAFFEKSPAPWIKSIGESFSISRLIW